jgi:hypothetical protein
MKMAKVAFSKLGLKKKTPEVKTVKINNVDVEVKQYLPVEEKLQLISNVLNNAVDDMSFLNPVKLDVCTNLEIVYFYTNLTFTDKQKEDPQKLYDLLEENDVFLTVIHSMDADEYRDLVGWIQDTIDSYTKYKDSALGILEAVSADYSNLDLETSELQKKIADPDNLTLLKDVMTKLG